MFHWLKPETGTISSREADGADLSFPTVWSAQMTNIGPTKSSHGRFIFYNRNLAFASLTLFSADSIYRRFPKQISRLINNSRSECISDLNFYVNQFNGGNDLLLHVA